MTERLHENEARVEELTKNWTSKWRETQKIIEVKTTGLGVGGGGGVQVPLFPTDSIVHFVHQNIISCDNMGPLFFGFR